MADSEMMTAVKERPGFIAALDQSGGSTPGALKQYGVPESAYSGDDEMFRMVHEMRVRIISAPAFTGEKVLGAILFERTMDGRVGDTPVPAYLWGRGIVPFLKVDGGLAEAGDGVRLMKPMPKLDALLDRAVAAGIFGTKMRSVIDTASQSGIAAIVAQQFEVASQISAKGLVPIIEPEVSIKSPSKAEAEDILLAELQKGLATLPEGRTVMFKVTLPDTPDHYAPLSKDPRTARVVALSGGYTRADACEKLSHNHDMIASFSRALVEDLQRDMSDADFDAALARAIDQIYAASARKH